MRFGTLAYGSIAALLTLTGCGTDNFLTNGTCENLNSFIEG